MFILYPPFVTSLSSPSGSFIFLRYDFYYLWWKTNRCKKFVHASKIRYFQTNLLEIANYNEPQWRRRVCVFKAGLQENFIFLPYSNWLWIVHLSVDYYLDFNLKIQFYIFTLYSFFSIFKIILSYSKTNRFCEKI